MAFFGLFILLMFIGLIGLGIMLITRSRGKALGYPACGKCSYDLTGTIGNQTRCPECGAAFADVGILAPTARRNRPVMWAGIVLVVLPLVLLFFAIMLPWMSMTRMSQARAAAQARVAIAQQQAATAQPQPMDAHTIAVTIPPPLAPGELERFNIDDLQKRLGQTVLSLHYAENLSADDRTRLESEWDQLVDTYLAVVESKPTGAP